MCTVLLPPGGYPSAVDKYIISYLSLAYASDLSLFDGRSSVLPSGNRTVIKTTGSQIFVLAAPHDSCRQTTIRFIFSKIIK
jgi:hypothetical protein